MNHLLRDRTFIGVHNTIWLLNWYRAWTSIYSLCMQREMPSNNKMEKFTHHWRTLDPSPEAWSRWLKREPQDQHHVPSSFTCMGGKKRKKYSDIANPFLLPVEMIALISSILCAICVSFSHSGHNCYHRFTKHIIRSDCNNNARKITQLQRITVWFYVRARKIIHLFTWKLFINILYYPIKCLQCVFFRISTKFWCFSAKHTKQQSSKTFSFPINICSFLLLF